MLKFTIKFIFYSFLLLTHGCAIYYHDSQTGADHIWGFGHLAMKAVPDSMDKQVYITQKTLAGVALGFDDLSPNFSLGWNRSERIYILDKNTSLAIQRPSNHDYFQFKFAAFPNELSDKK
jgi:hypothetical protein